MESDSQTASSPESDPPDYSDVIELEESPLYQAVVNVDLVKIRHLLDLDYKTSDVGQFGQTLLHALVYSLSSQPSDAECWSSEDRLAVVYMLVNSGVNVNATDQCNLTPLQYAVQFNDAELCHVFLQCGADMFVLEQNGVVLYESVMLSGNQSNDNCGQLNTNLKNVFEKYQPGLWNAVASEDLTAVRKLINLWCKTDIQQNTKTLLELAFDTGNEGIISLVSAVIPSMRLVHHVLARDVRGVKSILNSELRQKIHVNLKNLGFRGAPILYFVIRGKNLEMLGQFIKHGCSIVTHMSDGNDNEMPVLFSALQSDIPAEIITKLLPDPEISRQHLLEQLTYKGKHILQVALENDVVEDAVVSILEQGGARLLCTRNPHNQTPRDWALSENKVRYVDMIDNIVVQWVLQAERYRGQREILALWGYEHISDVVYQWMEDNAVVLQDLPLDVHRFFQELDKYQEQISELAEAIETDNLIAFKEKITYEGNGPFEKELYWDGRMKGDGLPLLHRAVIHGNFQIAVLILWQWEQCGNSDSVDNLRDQNRRTALHYASGMEHASDLCALLHQHGCSDHTLDKDGHEPLDFREVQGTPRMKALVDRLKFKNYHTVEPNPWDHEILDEIRRQRALRNSVVTTYACESCRMNRFHPALRSHSFPLFEMLSFHKPIPHCQSQVIARVKENHLSSQNRLNLNLAQLMLTDTGSFPEEDNEQSKIENQENQENQTYTESNNPLLNGETSESTLDYAGHWEDQREQLLPSKNARTNCTFL